MRSTIVIFTAVPQPTSDGRLRVGVLLSPRLIHSSEQPTPTLGSFELGRTPWPERLAALAGSLKVCWNGGPELAATLAPPRRSVEALDAQLWRALFPAERKVRSYVFDDERGRKVKSYPAATVAGKIVENYRWAAVFSPTEYPPIGVKVDDAGRVTRPAGRIDDWIKALSDAGDLMADYPFSSKDNDDGLGHLPADVRAYYDGLRFYTRVPRNQVAPPLPHDEPDFDFHEMVALIADHPTLQRKLGLVFDLLVDGPAPTATGTIEVRVPWTGSAEVRNLYPRTHYDLATGAFLPAAWSPGFVDRGYMRLETDKFDVLQVDVDGSLFKAADFAGQARRQLCDPDRPAIEATSLPALRTAGITIAQKNRKGWLRYLWNRQLDANAAATADLWADDLIRGYRIDVEVDGRWRSLCHRVGEIAVGGAGTVVIDGAQAEEGYVKAASATAGSFNPEEMYVHEAIAGWSGYSLCARPPGKSVVFDPTRREDHEQVVERRNDKGSHVDMSAEYRALPRSLPLLRYGKSYRFRARVADIAGGGLPPEHGDVGAVTPPTVYGRFEPVATPVLLHRTPITEGESLEHMVIRSAPGQSPAEYAQREDLRAAGYAAENHRHVLPPKSSLAQLEAHGELDDALRSRAATRSLYHLARRDAGTIADRTYVNIDRDDANRDGLELQVPGIELRYPPAGGSGRVPDAEWPTRGEPLGEGQYVLHSGETATLTYLRDPMAAGVAIWDTAPGSNDVGPVVNKLIWSVPGGRMTWARADSLRVELKGSTDGKIHREQSGKVLTFRVPPGQRLTLRYSSWLAESRLTHMALWNMLSPSERSVVLGAIRDGKHWMFGPSRELTLVHAVQKPLTAALFLTGAQVTRQPNGTVAQFDASIACDPYGAGHIDVRASWTEVVDHPHEPGPRLEQRHAELFRLQVPYGQAAVSTTQNLETTQRTPHSVDGYRTMKLRKLSAARPGQHELGDCKYRLVTYNPVSTTRYQEHFPAQLISDRANLETPGTAFPATLPASAPPDAPVIAQVIPTFGRFQDQMGAQHRVSGVRIYLDRPWFSSGAGEKLAVIAPPLATDLTDSAGALYSQWGRDPAWTAPSPAPLVLSSFVVGTDQVTQFGSDQPAPRVSTRTGVGLPGGLPGAADLVLVVPQFNSERGLWFCDLNLNTAGTYFPFLSLALARYQPNAMVGAELSRIVRAELVQLAPERTAIIFVNNGKIEVNVWGTSSGNSLQSTGAAGPGAAHRITAWVEQRVPSAGDLGWTPIVPVKTLDARATGNEVIWSTKLDKPTFIAGNEYRVVVTEAEVYAADQPANTGSERIVYVEMKNL